MCPTTPSLNYCSLYVDGAEAKGMTTLTKYLYDDKTGKSLCWPRLSVIGPAGSYKKGMNYVKNNKDSYKPIKASVDMGGTNIYSGNTDNDPSIRECESEDRLGGETCIGQIIRDSSGNPTDLSKIQTNGGEGARYTTKLKDIQFSNKIECDHKKGFCTVTPGIPESCGGNVNTLYHDIIDYVSDDKKKWIDKEALSDYTNMKGNEGGNKDCKEGYRKSVTWEYEEVKFQPNDVNNDKGLLTKVFKKNCSFCEKVLFTSSKVCSGGVDDSNCNDPNSTKDEGNVIGSITRDEKGSIQSITESEIIKLPAHDIMASYYLGTLKHNKEKNRLEFKGPDTLQLGSGDVWVFRVLPGMTLTDYENLEPPSNYVDPFNPFNGEGGVIVHLSGGQKKIVNLISDENMQGMKLGNNKILNDKGKLDNFMVDFYGCGDNNQGELCHRKRAGICPKGMIAVKNSESTVSCHTYISNFHRAGCYSKDGGIGQEKFKNSIASGSGEGLNEQSRNDAYGRLGCMNGFKLSESDGLLKCTKYKNIAGTSIKHCRNRTGPNGNKYGLVPVFKGGKLSFECRIMDVTGNPEERTCVDVTADNVVGFSPQWCDKTSVEVVLPSQMGYARWSQRKNLNNDSIKGVCNKHDISDVTDELGRRLNINRMTTMFLVNDCHVCL